MAEQNPNAKKAAKKAATKVSKKAPTKAAKTTKKVAKKAAKKPVKKSAVSTNALSTEEIAHAAYLNFRNRLENNLPGDSHLDWVEAEKSLTKKKKKSSP